MTKVCSWEKHETFVGVFKLATSFIVEYKFEGKYKYQPFDEIEPALKCFNELVQKEKDGYVEC